MHERKLCNFFYCTASIINQNKNIINFLFFEESVLTNDKNSNFINRMFMKFFCKNNYIIRYSEFFLGQKCLSAEILQQISYKLIFKI